MSPNLYLDQPITEPETTANWRPCLIPHWQSNSCQARTVEQSSGHESASQPVTLKGDQWYKVDVDKQSSNRAVIPVVYLYGSVPTQNETNAGHSGSESETHCTILSSQFKFDENSLSCNSIAGDHITTKFSTCHDSTAVMSGAKFCSEHFIRIWMKAKWNFPHIWILKGIFFSEMSPKLPFCNQCLTPCSIPMMWHEH